MKWLTEVPIAHRGLHSGKSVPENSIAAFERAAAHGFAVELDIHMLKSGELVVFHDDDLKRMTGAAGDIREQTLESIRKLRLYSSGEGIPLLDEVLEAVNSRVPILIEIKSRAADSGTEEALSRVLSQYKGEVAVQSFDKSSLQRCKPHLAGIPLGLLGGKLSEDGWLDSIGCRVCGDAEPLLQVDFIAFDHRHVPSVRVHAESKHRGLPLLAWTIASKRDASKALRYADNIIFEGFIPEMRRSKTPG